MSIRFSCPHCGHVTQVGDQYAGQSGPCVQCGKEVTVPTVAQARGSGLYEDTSPAPAPVGRSGAGRDSTLITCLVVGAILLFLLVGAGVALMIPAVTVSHENARRMECTNNLKQLAIAMHNYHDTHKRFPAQHIETDGVKTNSWRVAILPFIEQQYVFDQYNFDESWDSDNNLMVASQIDPSVFQCPDANEGYQYKMINGYMIPVSNYVVITDNDDNEETTTNMPGANSFTKIADIVDGTSNTIMIVEVKGEDAPAWCEPVDIDIEDIRSFGINGFGSIGSNHPGGANVALCDGSVHFIPEVINLETLDRLMLRNDGEVITPGSF